MDKLKQIFTEERVALILRWWAVGAIYFFIGWGTNLGTANIIDFVFFLGLSIGVFNMLIVNPVIRMMFNIKGTVRYGDLTLGEKIGNRLGEILKSMVIVFLMVYVYNIINALLIMLMNLPKDQVPLPGEPISFGIIYILIWSLFNSLIKSIKKRVQEKEIKVKSI